MENMGTTIQKTRDARPARKAGIAGIERMKWNLKKRLRGWMLRESGRRGVTVGEIVDRVEKYAPKTILECREAFESTVESIWGVTHGYSIAGDDWLRGELEYELSSIYNII